MFAQRQAVDDLIAELRATFLFAPFSEEQMYWLVARSSAIRSSTACLCANIASPSPESSLPTER
jgi:hypothetical protein